MILAWPPATGVDDIEDIDDMDSAVARELAMMRDGLMRSSARSRKRSGPGASTSRRCQTTGMPEKNDAIEPTTCAFVPFVWIRSTEQLFAYLATRRVVGNSTSGSTGARTRLRRPRSRPTLSAVSG